MALVLQGPLKIKVNFISNDKMKVLILREYLYLRQYLDKIFII